MHFLGWDIDWTNPKEVDSVKFSHITHSQPNRVVTMIIFAKLEL